MRAFDHIGIHTDVAQEGESWVEVSQIWVTNPRVHPQRIEYLRPLRPPQIDPADSGLWKLWNMPHIAYRVDDLQAAVGDDPVVLGPFESAEAKVVFVERDGAIVEYLQYVTLDTWYGQPTPWTPAGPPPGG